MLSLIIFWCDIQGNDTNGIQVKKTVVVYVIKIKCNSRLRCDINFFLFDTGGSFGIKSEKVSTFATWEVRLTTALQDDNHNSNW